jgi:hypothetical protein
MEGNKKMTELQLYKFIHENNIEIDWRGNCLIIWLYFFQIRDFVELVGKDYFYEDGYDINLRADCVAVDITDICEYHEVEPENILKKNEWC